MTAWNGTADEFWDALKAHVEQRETEGDAAVISDVLTTARLGRSHAAELRRFQQREKAVQDLLRALEYEPLGMRARQAIEAVRSGG